MKDFNIETHQKIATGFTLPNDAYFENLSEIINKKTINKHAKVVLFYQKRIFWFQAFAAIFIIGLGIFFFEQKYASSQVLGIEYLVSESNISIEEMAEQLTEADIEHLEKRLIIHNKESIENIEKYL